MSLFMDSKFPPGLLNPGSEATETSTEDAASWCIRVLGFSCPTRRELLWNVFFTSYGVWLLIPLSISILLVYRLVGPPEVGEDLGVPETLISSASLSPLCALSDHHDTRRCVLLSYIDNGIFIYIPELFQRALKTAGGKSKFHEATVFPNQYTTLGRRKVCRRKHTLVIRFHYISILTV